VALELQRADVVDAQVLAELERLGGLGYTIVLDGFVMRDDSLPLLEVADYVKLDARTSAGTSWPRRWRSWSPTTSS
jgi:c-di-GMP-related signal transduction protein